MKTKGAGMEDGKGKMEIGGRENRERKMEAIESLGVTREAGSFAQTGLGKLERLIHSE